MVADAGDIFAVMAGRRTCKHYTPRPVEMDKLLQVIQAGTLAPSSGNLQNWQFIVVSDVEKIRELYHHTLDQEPFLTAPAAVIVCGDVEQANLLYGVRGKRLYTVQNCAVATQNMLLAAEALGLGTTWIGAFDEDKVSAMFAIPERSRPQAIILFGYPDEMPPVKDLKPLENVVFFNRFGTKVMRPHLIYYDWATEWRSQAQKVKSHVAHTAHRISSARKRPAEGADGASQPPRPAAHERLRSSFEAASARMRDTIERLKRDEYRKSRLGDDGEGEKEKKG